MRKIWNKRLSLLIYLFFWAALFFPALLSAAPASPPVGNVDLVEGSAFVQREHQQSRSKIQQGDKVYPRDEITTESGAKIKITLINHSTIYLGGNSHLRIKAILPQKSQSFFKLYLGKLRAVVKKFSRPDSKFEVETKTAVAGVVGTEEIVCAYQDQTGQDVTQVVCQLGHLVVRSNEPEISGEINLYELEQSVIQDGEPPGEKVNISQEELENLVKETTPAMARRDNISGNATKVEKKKGTTGEKAGQKGRQESKQTGNHEAEQEAGQEQKPDQRELSSSEDKNTKAKEASPDRVEKAMVTTRQTKIVLPIKGLAEEIAAPADVDKLTSLDQKEDLFPTENLSPYEDRPLIENPVDTKIGEIIPDIEEKHHETVPILPPPPSLPTR